MFKKPKEIQRKKQELEKYEQELKNSSNYSKEIISLKIEKIKVEIKILKFKNIQEGIILLLILLTIAIFVKGWKFFKINFQTDSFYILYQWFLVILILLIYIFVIFTAYISFIIQKNKIYSLNLEKEEIIEKISNLYCEI